MFMQSCSQAICQNIQILLGGFETRTGEQVVNILSFSFLLILSCYVNTDCDLIKNSGLHFATMANTVLQTMLKLHLRNFLKTVLLENRNSGIPLKKNSILNKKEFSLLNCFKVLYVAWLTCMIKKGYIRVLAQPQLFLSMSLYSLIYRLLFLEPPATVLITLNG